MFTNRIRTIIGASITAAVVGLSALGGVGMANADTCYNYGTQEFYDC